jgi:hypothetical protein
MNIYLLISIMILFLITIIIKYNNKENFENNNKLCVIYNYYEKDELYKENFKYFLNNGILDNIDYYIIINGTCTVELPKSNNVFIYYRDNIGYDFGAYSYIIENKLNKNYDYYFFLNTSVKGPYLKNKNKKWYEYFIELFNKNVHLVGTSINICTNEEICLYDKEYNKKVNPHVQSMFFCLDSKYFNELKNENFFNEKEINKMEFIKLIKEKEIKLSQIAIEKGYNINCILSKYTNIDYININQDINPSSGNGDPYFKNAYFNQTIDPYEVIFYKTNRNM